MAPNGIAEAAIADLPDSATELYLRFRDSRFLHAGLHKAGLDVAWGPMPQDVLREGGEAAVDRALDWLVRRDPAALEPALDGPAMAFSLTVLSNCSAPASNRDCRSRTADRGGWRASLPDDRTMSMSPPLRRSKVRRIRLGRVSNVFPTMPTSAAMRQTLQAVVRTLGHARRPRRHRS